MSSASRPILFIDDNAALSAVYKTLLGSYGFRVTTALDCQEALFEWDRSAEDMGLAIVDLRMPGLDGPDTIAALKTRKPRIKVIATSGEYLGPYFSRLAELGVRHFLPKPFCATALLSALHEVLTEGGGLTPVAL